MRGFIEFIREQGVVGLAVGFILGGSVSKFVTALVEDIVSPLLSLALGRVENLKGAYFTVSSAKILWGDFVNVAIDFVMIATVVYFGVKLFRLDKLQARKKD